ncbi:MAG: 7-carboxy-7-deazaguanine synthase QueE [Gammaproteobacteria bacterium]|nr:7-carboxy-7-deazaguanine synthase QueE [Gammaproteobacteria bacterium]
MTEIVVSEIFGPTIQGEGALIGLPTVFVRTGGCDFICAWCDTLYAVDKKFKHHWKRMDATAILQKVDELSGNKPLCITLSGGNPAIQPLGGMIELGRARGYTFALETQGSVSKDWFVHLDALTLSPKPPSSLMSFSPEKLNACIEAAGSDTKITLKIVISDEIDLDWAIARHQSYPDIAMVLQPCNTMVGDNVIDLERLAEQMRWLVDEVNRRQLYKVRVLPQLHVQLWGNQRGV